MEQQPPRWRLRLKALLFRFIGKCLSFLHTWSSPRPISASFKRTIPSTISPQPGRIGLLFYTPKDYYTRKATYQFPAVVNYHGGGFVVGTPADDSRWATALVQQTDAVVISVDYRMAPEYPFPTAVEDSADALLYVFQNAKELGIDPTKVATSGFSAGGNLCITAAMRFREELRMLKLRERVSEATMAKVVESDDLPLDYNIAAIVSWYPTLDYTMTRDERRATCSRPEKTLPPTLTDLLDQSYLHPEGLNMSDPYLSPGVASDELLKTLPEDIILYTCEWDMLQAEGKAFRDRLHERLGKRVRFTMVEEVVHAWDKHINPFMDFTSINKLYAEACHELNVVFTGKQL
ncbi:MAG: hypothetical protein M1819_004567 [Sarea resinae]|nr:MAG: hypothetical protein M1819_004567 [Sarea resinae]